MSLRNQLQSILFKAFLTIAVAFVLMPVPQSAAEGKIQKKKLQIVFCFGQSNMVGMATVPTAWYLTQPQYVPPKEALFKKTEMFDWNFYWNGVNYYKGPRKAELDALLAERRASRDKWRQRIGGEKWDPSWGEKPKSGRENVYAFLDQKASEEGIYKRMAEILDAPENQFNMEAAYAEIIKRDEAIAEELTRVREIYLKGTTGADFDAFNQAVADANKAKTLITETYKNSAPPNPSKQREIYAQMAEQHLRLPIGKRVRIYAHGAVAGEGEGVMQTASGPLTVGYGAGVTRIGPEYAVGITLERLVDAPILIVKCAWGNTSIAEAWRAPSLDGVETPIEKQQREAWNLKQAELAKQEGREFKPNEPRTKTGQLAWCWNMVMPQVDKVLADPGKFHPEYDPSVGYEVAGMVWFQGYSDKDNPAYGELLAAMIKDFREKVKTPNMPVVCGSLGMEGTFKHLELNGAATEGMVYASQLPENRGTVDVVNTGRFFPTELGVLDEVKSHFGKGTPEFDKAELVKRAVSDKNFHYMGSAKFFLLMGDASARSLANLMNGGTPTIDAELKRRADGNH